MKKEIIWIDWVKFICMVFVYWCHVIQLGDNKSPLSIPYGPFFVNGFFFISGYLYFGKYLSDKYLKQDAKTFLKNAFHKQGMFANILFKIAVPSIIFSAFDFIPKTYLSGTGFSTNKFIFDTFIRGTNWFTCALTVSEILISILLLTRIKNMFFYVGCCLSLAIIGVFFQNNDILVLGNEYAPWFYKSGLIACSFLGLGGLYRRYEEMISKKGFGALSLVIYLCIICNENLSHVKVSTLGGIDLSGFCISVISILALINICKQFPEVSFVQYISRHTIGFYFLSVSVPYGCIKLTNLYIPVGLFSFFLQLFLSFTISWLIIFLLERYVPFIFDLRLIKKKI